MSKRTDDVGSLHALYVTLPSHLELAAKLNDLIRRGYNQPRCGQPAVGITGVGKVNPQELWARLSLRVRVVQPEEHDGSIAVASATGTASPRLPAYEAQVTEWCRAWANSAGLQLPEKHPNADRLWPLTVDDVYIAALYYAACRAHSPSEGSSLFAGTRKGAPHLVMQWYPASFWVHLCSFGFRRALRRMPAIADLPSVSDVQTMLCGRYDHNHLYRFYQDADGKVQWSFDDVLLRAASSRSKREHKD